MKGNELFWICQIVVILCVTAILLGLIVFRMHFNELEHDLYVREMAYDRIFGYMENIHNERGVIPNETEQGIQVFGASV